MALEIERQISFCLIKLEETTERDKTPIKKLT